MKKRKQEVEIFEGKVYNSTYLHYDINGKILDITIDPPTSINFLEISNDLIKDFKLGKKIFYNYDINFFKNLKEGIIQKDESIISYTSFLYDIPVVDHYKNEITLLYSSKEGWSIKIRDDVTYEKSYLNFFICKKNDPCYFYSYLMFDLNNPNLLIKFNNNFEKDLSMFSVMTMKKFNSYGIKEIK